MRSSTSPIKLSGTRRLRLANTWSFSIDACSALLVLPLTLYQPYIDRNLQAERLSPHWRTALLSRCRLLAFSLDGDRHIIILSLFFPAKIIAFEGWINNWLASPLVSVNSDSLARDLTANYSPRITVWIWSYIRQRKVDKSWDIRCSCIDIHRLGFRDTEKKLGEQELCEQSGDKLIGERLINTSQGMPVQNSLSTALTTIDSDSAQLGPSQTYLNICTFGYCSRSIITSRVKSSQRHHGKHAL